MAVNIKAIRPLADFEADMEALIAQLKRTPRRPDTDEIYYPGELEALSDARLRKAGIQLPKDTAEDLRNQARGLGVSAPF